MTFAPEFYKGKKVFITGHTGFKGSWLTIAMKLLGAEVTGYSLEPDTDPALFYLANAGEGITSVTGDIRDRDALMDAFNKCQPEIVFHLAAQPIVRTGYEDPVLTYETNVLGTLNILECARCSSSVKSFLNITTDKVYLNEDLDTAFKEDDPLDGYDPYSNSKSCSELVTHSYKKSFLEAQGVAVSTARAGNVIGGGDFARDRIIPDCVRAARDGRDIIVRNPYSTRPFQHVLEPIYAYMMIAALQYGDPQLSGWYNVGPGDEGCSRTGDLTDTFIKYWGNGLKWINQYDGGPHEASFLKLDCTKLKETFGWTPRWNVDEAVKKTVEWTKNWLSGGDVREFTETQIREFFGI